MLQQDDNQSIQYSPGDIIGFKPLPPLPFFRFKSKVRTMVKAGYRIDASLSSKDSQTRCANCGSRQTLTVVYWRQTVDRRKAERKSDERSFVICLACYQVHEEIAVRQP